MQLFNSLVLNVAFLPMVVFGQLYGTKPRIYTNQAFFADSIELPLDGSCQNLRNVDRM